MGSNALQPHAGTAQKHERNLALYECPGHISNEEPDEGCPYRDHLEWVFASWQQRPFTDMLAVDCEACRRQCKDKFRG